MHSKKLDKMRQNKVLKIKKIPSWLTIVLKDHRLVLLTEEEFLKLNEKEKARK